MKKTLIVGHFEYKSSSIHGGAVKVQELYRALEMEFGKNVLRTLDITDWRKQPCRILLKMRKDFSECKNVVLVISTVNLYLLKIINLLKHFYHNRLFYVLVGGALAENIEGKIKHQKQLTMFHSFWVETQDCLLALKSLGFNNVHVLKNFKFLDIIKSEDVHNWEYNNYFKFVYLGRVIKDKGITDAIRVVETINRDAKFNCIFDIYGPVDSSYQNEFHELLKNSRYCYYNGVVKPNETVKILKNYYMFIFPTKRFRGEGIPGAIIDSYAAGLPVIASKWCGCNSVIEDNVTGLVYKFAENEELAIKILYSMKNIDFINSMKRNCIYKAKEYDYRIVTKEFFECLIKDD